MYNLDKAFIKKTICFTKNSLLPKDIFVNLLLTKTSEIYEYVDVKKDEKTYSIDRQLINPYYINFGFFSSVSRIKLNSSLDLNLQMKNYLNTTYTNSVALYSASTQPVEAWFDDIGYNILANDIIATVDEVTGLKSEENGLERLEKVSKDVSSVVSKSFYFPISINK